MGDRANIVVVNRRPVTRSDGKPLMVYLYSHWGGSELPEVLRLALARRLRWDDDQYLARIIFDQMVGDQHGEEANFGISAALMDNSYPVLVVDCQTQTVGFAKEGEEPECSKIWTFEEYIAKQGVSWPDESER